VLRIEMDGDGVWPDLADKLDRVVRMETGRMTSLPDGMTSGKPSVMLRIDLPDGQIVLYEMSLRLFLTAADAFKARYGDPRT
jgi:hypothetical protein